MIEEVTFDPPEDGGTDFHRVISSKGLRVTRPFQPRIEPIFRTVFRESTDRLEAYCERAEQLA